MDARRLSYDELLMLRLVQARYGPQNTLLQVFFSPAAEACIAAADPAGAARGVLNLTRLGAWYRSGRLTLDEVRAWIASGGTRDPGVASER